MCGVPFAGKTTLARAIAANLGFALLEVDQITRQRHPGDDGGRLSRQEWAAAYREAYRRLRDLLAAEESVVYDATNFRRLQRDQLRRLATPFAARTLVVWVAPPLPAVTARRARNRQHPTRPAVHDADFAEVVDAFQRPGDDEATLRYDGAERAEVWVERHRGELA